MRKTILLMFLFVLVIFAISAAGYFVSQRTIAHTNISLEAEQIILPEDHLELPLDTMWVVVQGPNGPIEAPIPLSFPESWADKYEARVSENLAYYDSVVQPCQRARIFSIAALTEDQWQDIQAEPHGEFLFSYGGIVYVYNPALENLFTGAAADEFSRMVGESRSIANSLSLYFAPTGEMAEAYAVLQAYFKALNEGDYTQAAMMYGGEFDILREYNPEIDPENHAELFEAACGLNGFLCDLRFKNLVQAVYVSDETYKFLIELQTKNGLLFELGPCTENAPLEECLLVTQFEYTVQLTENQFRVTNLPVYMP
jgi:hypothetical protein